jgi:hypothetical protein
MSRVTQTSTNFWGLFVLTLPDTDNRSVHVNVCSCVTDPVACTVNDVLSKTLDDSAKVPESAFIGWAERRIPVPDGILEGEVCWAGYVALYLSVLESLSSPNRDPDHRNLNKFLKECTRPSTRSCPPPCTAL